MKKLLLVRHAKASSAGLSVNDFDRPLAERGQRDASIMAARFCNYTNVPEHLLSSPALRAISTAEIFASEWNIPITQIARHPGIYEADFSDLLKIVNNADNEFSYIALYGHNPGISDLAFRLCGADTADMPTCAMLLIEFPFDDWAMISEQTGERRYYIFPDRP